MQKKYFSSNVSLKLIKFYSCVLYKATAISNTDTIKFT